MDPGGPIPGTTERRNSDRVRLLVVERDSHVRELEWSLLEDAGFDVVFAADGVEALGLARSERFDVIVSEILVPRLDGLALCREIKSDPALRGTSVLILSVLSAEVRAREAGADAFARKPLGEPSLVPAVQRLLASRAKTA